MGIITILVCVSLLVSTVTLAVCLHVARRLSVSAARHAQLEQGDAAPRSAMGGCGTGKG